MRTVCLWADVAQCLPSCAVSKAAYLQLLITEFALIAIAVSVS